ncbi:MAG: endolytic transglycosylase MltG [Desulfobacterales bacterium]
MKKFFLFSTITLLYIFSAALFIGYHELIHYAQNPASTKFEPNMISIQPGQSFKSITEKLYDNGIIDNIFKFKLYTRIKGFDRDVKAGQYLLSPDMSPQKIIEVLVRGKVYLYRITIPEGYNLYELATLLEKTNIVKSSDFLSAANDTKLIQHLGINAKNFEGYLFPDTYFFEKDAAPEKIISTMVKQFYNTFNPLWEKRSSDLQLSMHEIVTLASIIEKETGLAEERPLISSVFHNRLKKNMRLQSDPTVIYGVENFDGNLTRKHLQTPTPYNTYTLYGLPPAPIAAPGKASLEAAIFPPESPYLFFVSKKDRSHFFSTNYEDHKAAVRKYQLNQ